MGLAGRLGRNGEQSGTQLPSLPSVFISLSILRKLAEKSCCILSSGRKKKGKVSRGGGSGSQGGCAGLVLGGAEALQCTELQLWAAGGRSYPALVEVQFAARIPSSEKGAGKVVGSRKAKHLQQSKLNPKPSP